MAIKFSDLANDILLDPNTLVLSYNAMIDPSMTKETSVDEMRKILYWSFAAMHRLNNLSWLNDDGGEIDVISIDVRQEFAAVLNHNIVLLINNWRQTQFFQNDDNGKDVAEIKNQPVSLEGLYASSVNAPTTSASVAYNLFSINLTADRNLTEVSKLLLQIYADFRQHLKGVVSR